MLPFLLAAGLWALPSFLLHNIIHEGAHALVAKFAGASKVSLWPFPGNRLGYFTWANMSYEGVLLWPQRARWIHIAPVLAECDWLVPALLALFFAPFGWWSGILAVEAVSPVVDITTWVIPYWRKNPNAATDAMQHQAQFGWFSNTTGRLYSLLVLIPAGLVVWGLVRLLVR